MALLVPACLILVSLLLVGVTWFERWVLSPQALIVHTARARNVDPEHVEKLVALESERLMNGMERTAG